MVQFLPHTCVSFLFEALKADAVQQYQAGIIDDAACDDGPINHGVLLVGYGTGTVFFCYTVQWGLVVHSRQDISRRVGEVDFKILDT